MCKELKNGPIRAYLTCCCCDGDAGFFVQHYNRDEGYGVCAKCVSRMMKGGTSTEEIKRLYGVAGVNFEAPMYVLYGRRFVVLAEFPATEAGIASANQFMRENDGAALLAEADGRLVLAHKNDKGIA